jgi:hypothetical protein
LIFTDEASFRQDSTLHATWSRLGHPPEIRCFCVSPLGFRHGDVSYAVYTRN